MTMKWPIWPKWPPSFRTLRAIHLALGVGAIALAAITGPSWLSMLDMACGGFLIGSWAWLGRVVAMQEGFDQCSKAFHMMSDLNRQLIAGKVKIIIEGGDANAPAEQPRLH